jgi:hypothetical protein
MMNVTVEELHRYLSALIEQGKGEHVVRIAYQPSYPLEAEIAGYVADEDSAEDAAMAEGPEAVYADDPDGLTAEEKAGIMEAHVQEARAKAQKVIYLVTAQGNSYLQASAGRDLWDHAAEERYNYYD